MKQILIEDEEALRFDALLARAPGGRQGDLLIQRNAARDLAARLEQELAETQRRCTALIHLWTTTGSMAHAAQLAEALDLGPDLTQGD